jgi:pimeloyl-ACP methyl ester carboxylesterase
MTEVTRVRAGRLTLEVLDVDGQDPAFVLVHGLTSSRHIWDLVIPHLAPHRVVAYDQRGHGQSDKPKRGYGFVKVAGDLGAVMDAREIDRAIVVGHSWGASVALEFAVAEPRRVLGLALVDGGFTELRSRPAFSTFKDAWAVMKPPDIDGTPRKAFLARARKFMPNWNKQVREMFMTMFRTDDEDRVYRRFPVHAHKQVVRAMWDQQTFALFGQVRSPVLLVPSYMKTEGPMAGWMQAKREGIARALTLLRDGRVEEMEDTLHDSPVQRPRELAALLRSFAEDVGKAERASA